MLNEALLDGHKPALALSIVGQGETAQAIKHNQGIEPAIDYLNKLYVELINYQESEQERQQSREQEWEL